MKETLYHRVTKCAKRPVRHNYIENPSSPNAVYSMICLKEKANQFSERPSKKSPQPCSLLLFSDSLCVIVRCFSTTLSLEARFGHAAVMVNCWAFEQFHGG